MFYLALSVIFSAIIGNLLILFRKDDRSDILIIFLGNYFLASLYSLSVSYRQLAEVGEFDIGLGIITGLFFLINFILYQKNISANGLSLSVSVMRFSLLLPILVSVLFFYQSINLFNYLGIAIILFSFVFMAETKAFGNIVLILALFLITGISETCLKVFSEFGRPDPGTFIFFLFSAALIFNLGLILIKRRRISWISFVYGLILGIPNQLTTRFFLKSLDSVPAAVAYPLMAASVVLICFLADLIIWKRRFNWKQKIGMIIIILGIILLNLK